jgi:hypothetical protein
MPSRTWRGKVVFVQFDVLAEYPSDDRCADCGCSSTVYRELGFRGEFTHSRLVCLECHASEDCEVNLYLFNEALATIRELAIK